MYVAWRDLRNARGRFLLMITVIGLLSILVGFLSGLTGGLAHQNISAVTALPGDRVVMAATTPGAKPTWSDSTITNEQATRWSSAHGVASVIRLGVSQQRAEAGSVDDAVAVFGADAPLGANPQPAQGEAVLSQPAAKALKVSAGDSITIAGKHLVVQAISGADWYSHLPVIYTTLGSWQTIADATGSPGAYASALLVSGNPDWSSVDSSAGTRSTATLASVSLLPAFSSEVGSLLLIVGMLFGISALVVGAFFTVWTIQRKGDIAILKALGASDRALRSDALGQALVVLATGIVAGMGLTTIAGLAIQGSMPFLLSPLTTLVPAVLMAVLGLAGAALAVRSISSAQPLTALGSNR